MYRLYRNLANGKVSILDRISNLVVGYADEVAVKDPTFVVERSGVRMAKKTNNRNVHAFIQGEIVYLSGFESRLDREVYVNQIDDLDFSDSDTISYHYEVGHFFNTETKEEAISYDYEFIMVSGKYAKGIKR